MLSIYICIFVAAVSVGAEELLFNERNMPIKRVVFSFGQGPRKRVDYVEAEIYPRHLTDQKRDDFPGPALNEYFRGIRAPGDERGHLVGPQFSGPGQWYNLSPQNARVNRHIDYQCITTDWYGAECEVRKFLGESTNRYVSWIVNNTFIEDSNRPHEYHLQVTFYENSRKVDSIDSHSNNPFKKEDSNFWICKYCRPNRHVHNIPYRRWLIEDGCTPENDTNVEPEVLKWDRISFF